MANPEWDNYKPKGTGKCFWIDWKNGKDKNDGLSSSTPVQTYKRLFEVIDKENENRDKN